MKIFITIILSLYSLTAAHAQYAPQVGVSGSTAIHAGSPSFHGWATGCVVHRGYIDIANPNAGLVTSGTDANGIGSVDNSIISLGDSGVALLTFATPIYNGPGADFAVFENGFLNPNDPEDAFLELAFVEVSSNGVDFFRFPAHSLTSTSPQIPGAGVYMDATLINNLAGKYISNNGTPFDLEDLVGTPNLDVNFITHIRLVDVVGAVNGAYGSVDTAGNLINDPYPTNFPIGGFDLDAVGAIHQFGLSASSFASGDPIAIYPNPVFDLLFIKASGNYSLTLTDVTGRVLYIQKVMANTSIEFNNYASGIYYLQLQNENGEKWLEKIVKQIKYLFFLSIFLAACVKDKPTGPDTNPYVDPTAKNVYIVCEGSFGNGNSALSLYRPETDSVYEDVYHSANSQSLGDVFQSMLEIDDRLFLCVNNSDKIIVVNKDNWSLIGTIPVSKPRYIQVISSTKAYVSSLYTNKVTIINPQTFQVTGTVTMPGNNPEGMLLHNGQLYVALWDTAVNKLYSINANTDHVSMIQTLHGAAPKEIVLDKDGKLWVLGGNIQKNKAASLTRIDPDNNQPLAGFVFPTGADPLRLGNQSCKRQIVFY